MDFGRAEMVDFSFIKIMSVLRSRRLRKVTEPFKRLYDPSGKRRRRRTSSPERYGTVVILKTIIRTSARSQAPGAYHDRYLDRVTINTDPWKVALGIIWGPRGKVTYTYLYPLLPISLLLGFPSPSRPSARYSESNYFRYSFRYRPSYCLCFSSREKIDFLHQERGI